MFVFRYSFSVNFKNSLFVLEKLVSQWSINSEMGSVLNILKRVIQHNLYYLEKKYTLKGILPNNVESTGS